MPTPKKTLKMKKETTLSLLREIRDLLKTKEASVVKPIPVGLFKITDDGKKKTSEIFAECKARFTVYSWWSDKKLDESFPPPKSPTTRYFEKTVEPSEKYANKSFLDMQKEGIPVITLRERLLMELQYFEETGTHLDLINTTLTGSIDVDGDAVRVCWDPGSEWLYMGRYDLQRANPSLRSRAVSL